MRRRRNRGAVYEPAVPFQSQVERHERECHFELLGSEQRYGAPSANLRAWYDRGRGDDGGFLPIGKAAAVMGVTTAELAGLIASCAIEAEWRGSSLYARPAIVSVVAVRSS